MEVCFCTADLRVRAKAQVRVAHAASIEPKIGQSAYTQCSWWPCILRWSPLEQSLSRVLRSCPSPRPWRACGARSRKAPPRWCSTRAPASPPRRRSLRECLAQAAAPLATAAPRAGYRLAPRVTWSSTSPTCWETSLAIRPSSFNVLVLPVTRRFAVAIIGLSDSGTATPRRRGSRRRRRLRAGGLARYLAAMLRTRGMQMSGHCGPRLIPTVVYPRFDICLWAASRGGDSESRRSFSWLALEPRSSSRSSPTRSTPCSICP